MLLLFVLLFNAVVLASKADVLIPTTKLLFVKASVLASKAFVLATTASLASFKLSLVLLMFGNGVLPGVSSINPPGLYIPSPSTVGIVGSAAVSCITSSKLNSLPLVLSIIKPSSVHSLIMSCIVSLLEAFNCSIIN